MMGESEGRRELTFLLNAWQQGDLAARDALFERVYPRIRAAVLRQRGVEASLTFDATEVAHEVYLRLAEGDHREWECRAQFFRLVAMAVRQVLVDHARRRNAEKRGGGRVASEVVLENLPGPERSFVILRLDQALERLARTDEVAARIVELRYFAGLTIPKVAETLGIGTATVSRRWEVARAWLRREL